MHVLSHDGNLVDASCIAVLAALQHFRKPDTSTEGQDVTVYTLAEREPVPLSLLHYPYCVTFSYYSDPNVGTTGEEGAAPSSEVVTLLDATLIEEQLKEGSATIGINRHGEVCQIAKLGGVQVDAVAFLGCVQLALAKVKDISAFVTRRLEEDAKKRDKGGLMAELRAQNDR